jgi:hypothetical protein
MLWHRVGRPRGARRQGLVVGLALVAPVLFALVGASSALAAPKGIFAKYSDCPTNVPGDAICTYGVTTSGEFAIGSTKVPINKPITLQGGGIHTGGSNFNEYYLLPAKDGNSLSKTELNVPGGLLDLVNCEEIKGNGLLEKLERAPAKRSSKTKRPA